jgi:hypothetical protein
MDLSPIDESFKRKTSAPLESKHVLRDFIRLIDTLEKENKRLKAEIERLKLAKEIDQALDYQKYTF